MAEIKINKFQISFPTLNSNNPKGCKTLNLNTSDYFQHFLSMKHTDLERNRKRSWIEQQKEEREEDFRHQVPAISATLLLLPDCSIPRRRCDLSLTRDGDNDPVAGLSILKSSRSSAFDWALFCLWKKQNYLMGLQFWLV